MWRWAWKWVDFFIAIFFFSKFRCINSWYEWSVCVRCVPLTDMHYLRTMSFSVFLMNLTLLSLYSIVFFLIKLVTCHHNMWIVVETCCIWFSTISLFARIEQAICLNTLHTRCCHTNCDMRNIVCVSVFSIIKCQCEFQLLRAILEFSLFLVLIDG